MKRSLILSAIFTLCVAPQAFGAIFVHDDIRINYITGAPSFGNGGGPFQAYVFDDHTRAQGNGSWVGNSATSTGSAIASFVTFCVERSNHFSPGSTYDIFGFNTKTVTDNKFLSGYAAFAYDKFSSSGLNPALGANQSAMETFQIAIWAGMTAAITDVPGSAGAEWQIGTDSITGLDSSAFTSLGIGWTQFLSSWAGADQNAKLANLNGYKVINIQDNNEGAVQDMVLAKSATLGVPEPASLAVWSILAGGAAGLSVARRRRATARGRWSNDNREAILSVIEGKHGH